MADVSRRGFVKGAAAVAAAYGARPPMALGMSANEIHPDVYAG